MNDKRTPNVHAGLCIAQGPCLARPSRRHVFGRRRGVQAAGAPGGPISAPTHVAGLPQEADPTGPHWTTPKHTHTIQPRLPPHFHTRLVLDQFLGSRQPLPQPYMHFVPSRPYVTHLTPVKKQGIAIHRFCPIPAYPSFLIAVFPPASSPTCQARISALSMHMHRQD